MDDEEFNEELQQALLVSMEENNDGSSISNSNLTQVQFNRELMEIDALILHFNDFIEYNLHFILKFNRFYHC